jgi:lysylphosphatidylglycerol synthetase-like protein (DUF2156 family)
MGDSGLTTYLAVVAMVVIIVALILAAVAWRVRRRTIRISIGLGLVIAGLLCAPLSLVAFMLVAGLGMAVCRRECENVPKMGMKSVPPSAG